MKDLYLIAGLGNPSEEYANTRHNAGFDAIDLMSKEISANYWKSESGALCAHGKFNDHELILAKPMSFMNLSGGPVSSLLKKYDIEPDHLIVIHDELDLPLGSIRIKFGGGLAGHNGLKSIANKIGTQDFFRIRIGIERPPGKMSVSDYVLRTPRGEDRELLDSGIALAAEAGLYLVENGLIKSQDKFN